MRKIISLVLAVTMLCSLIAIPVSAQTDREEILNSREYTYLDINPNIDAFASLETIRNYATLKNAVSSSEAHNKVTTVYGEDGETVLYTYMNQLLNETHDGTPITGEETYYKKGIMNAAVDAVRISPAIYITEAYNLTEEQLKELKIKTYSDLASAGTSQTAKTIAEERYADSEKYAEKEHTFAASDIKNLPTVVSTETVGDNYNVYIKDPETAVQFKLGPMNDSEYVKNALDVSRNANNAEIPAGTKGKYISVVAIATEVNNGSGYDAANNNELNIGSANAALQEFEITYSDDEKETRYVLVTNNAKTPYGDRVGISIYSADKFDESGNEIVYTSDSFKKATSETNPLTALTDTELTLDDIIFPSNVDAKEISVGLAARARQDASSTYYSSSASLGTFELQDKEIKAVKFIHDGEPGDEAIEGIIPITSPRYTNAPRALIPVQLPADKAEANKVYFAYVGRVSSAGAILGATISSESLQEKIEKVNEKLNAIDVNTITKEECDALRLEVAELKASNTVIVDADFATSKLEQAEEKFAESERIEKLEQKEMYYYPIEYNRDGFATYAEILEYALIKSGGTYPDKDLAGNPLDTTDPWFGYKGLDKVTPGASLKSSKIFLIDSIEGIEGGKVSAEKYTSATDYTKKTGTKTLQINGVENYKLQSTEANGAKNYIYNAGEMKYKFGSIGGTGDRLTSTGGYNVKLIAEGGKEKFTRTQDGAKKLGALFTLVRNNEGTSYAALEKAVVTYNDGRPAETKYLVMTAMNSDDDIYANTDSDGDRLGRVVVAVPKKDSAGTELDHTSGAVLKANAKILSEKTSEEIAGKKLTIEDVTFPADFVVGESMPIADYVVARVDAIDTDRRWGPQGYANHFEFDFGSDVDFIEYQGGIGYAKTYPGAILNSQVAYIPVTIEGASEDYLYYARFGRPCGYTVALLAASSMGGSIGDRIVVVNEQLAAAETKAEIISALDAVKALIDAGEGTILAKDFDTASATAKLAAHISADIEKAKSVAEIEAIEVQIDDYLVAYGYNAAALESAVAERLVVLERLEELAQGEKYDLVDIDWNYVDNSKYLINAFEMSSVVSIESATDYYASISGQSYINTKSTYEHITIAEALAKEELEADGDSVKNFTGTTGYSYYPTDKIQAKTGTFPAADGKYYITAPSGAKFEIKGVTSEVGANGNNAGYLTYDETNKENGGTIYKVDLDGKTQYNNVNVLVTGVGEPVWNGSPRQTLAAQANIYYADGSTEKQLIIVPTVWGYVPALAGKLKTQDQLTGINVKHNYVDATSAVLGLCNTDKFNWAPSNVNAEVFDVGSYMTTAKNNNVEERHTFYEFTKHTGAFASVSVDTKGKAVDYVEITYAEEEVLKAAGAFNAATNGDTHVYWLPIANEEVLELMGEDKAGVIKNQNDAKVSECDFYLKVQRNAAYSGRGGMAVLFAANAEKKYENLLAYVEEAQAAMESVSENSKLEDVFKANEIYENALAQEGIKESDFDAALVAKFEALINTVKEKTDVKGVLEVQYFENAETTVNVKLTNLAELAGKKFAVLLTYLDEEGVIVGSKTFTGESTAAKEQTVTFEDENAPAGAAKVKAYLWKALGSLKPLGEPVTVAKKSYAVDRFFNVEEGTFKADATGDLNVLFLGDSLTEGSSTYEIDGENADRPDHWTNVIAMYMKDNLPEMKVNVLNGGIGGTTTSFQAPILDGYALKCEPDIVFIQNVNNYNSSSTKSTVESVEAIVRSLLKLDKVPTIIYYHAYSPYTPENTGVTYPVKVQTARTNEIQKQHRDDIDALLEKYNVASLDYISYFLDYTNNCTDEIMLDLYNEGNVHPKTAGYNLMGTYATAEFTVAPEEFFKRNVLKAQADAENADEVYKVTYPNDSRFTYKNFTVYDNVDDAHANDINKRQYAFPFNGNVAQTRVGGAEITFESSAKEVVIYYVNPLIKYRTNTVKVYVDGELKANGAGANEWASNYDNIKITDLDGAKHTIKLVTDEPTQHSSGSTLDIFNFMFLAEKQ